eukprot:Skav208374  [mRNA]  locus=scaffold1964:730000:732768:- [translate_table: standard]
MQGIATFQLDVFLADFVLGVPEDVSLGADHLAPPENREIWTAFEAKENSTNEACAALCRHTLQCFMHYVGQEGCFMAFGDHNSLETSPGPPLLLANGRRISGKVAGCGANRTEDECSMTAPLKQSIRFPGVQPDWRSKAAAIEFSLEVEAGEQKHEAEATVIQVQQGPPVPVDAIAILLGEKNNESTVLNSTTTVDRLGKVSVEVAEYDPFNIDSLRLLLLDFHTSWASFSTANQEDLPRLEQHPKCTESPLNRARYAACGVPSHGQVRAMPISAPLGVWSGETAERLEFQVLPKEAAPWWTTSQQSVAITFAGADSPVAWAARREGCRVLQLASKQEVAASADAACHLLSQNCTEEVCKLLNYQGFGGIQLLGGYRPPKLRSKSLAQALRCQSMICDRNYIWELSNGILSMVDHSAKLAVTDLLAEAAKSDGLALVTSIRHGLPEASRYQFLEELAKEVWTLPSVPLSFIAGLANLSAEMPDKLLEEWVTSAKVAVPENATELSQLQAERVQTKLAVFASVDEVAFSLTEPEQLERVAQALQLAPNLEELEAYCTACPVAPPPWPRWPLAPQVRTLTLEEFVLPTLPEGAFRNFTELEGLWLRANGIQTLAEKTFEGLGALKQLYLYENDPGLKRPSVCEQKKIRCLGPWD